MKTATESSIVKSVLSWLNKQPGVFAWKTHGGMYGQAGIPDIVGVAKGQFFAFEMKRPGHKNKATKLQLHTIEKMKQAGAVAAVCDSKQEVMEIVSRILNQ